LGGIGWQELLIVFVILLLIFGATRLPALAKSLGSSVHGFKKGLQEGEEEEQTDKAKVVEAQAKEEPKPADKT